MQIQASLTASRSMQKEMSIQAVATVYKYGLQEGPSGKFFIRTVSANMVLAGDGRLSIMAPAETKVFVAMIAAKANHVAFP